MPGTKTFTDVVSGTYTITETNPAPAFDLTDITCSDGSPGNVGTGEATVSLQAGETVTCTFTNTERGTIIVEKQTDPDGASGSFTFSDTIESPFTFSLSDDGTQPFTDVVSGTYTITETNPAPAFDLTDITCSDGDSTGDEGTGVATVNVDAGETVTCTFTNTERGTIIVEKQTDPDGAAGTFTFSGDAAGTISDGQQIVVSDLAPGTYTSQETVPSGWGLTAIVCDDTNSSGDLGSKTATFQLEAGETVTCTFTNTQLGTIIVEKQTDPDGAPGNFTFSGDAAGTISDGQQIVVSDLAPGTYTSTEADPTPGFDLTAITCDDGGSATPSTGNVGTRKATFNLDPGETVKCTFTNALAAPPVPVGGIVVPVNRLELLAPWMGLAALAALAALGFALVRRRRSA